MYLRPWEASRWPWSLPAELGVNLKQFPGHWWKGWWPGHPQWRRSDVPLYPMRSCVHLCQVKEVLYSAMEDFYIDIMIGAGETSQCPPGPSSHLLIGATTRAGMLSNPCALRFGIAGHMEYWARWSDRGCRADCQIFRVITHETEELSLRSRGPLELPTVCSNRCTWLTINYRQGPLYGCGPWGLGTMSIKRSCTAWLKCTAVARSGLGLYRSILRRTYETVEDMAWPYLIQKSFIMRTDPGARGDPSRLINTWVIPTMETRKILADGRNNHVEQIQSGSEMMKDLGCVQDINGECLVSGGCGAQFSSGTSSLENQGLTRQPIWCSLLWPDQYSRSSRN